MSDYRNTCLDYYRLSFRDFQKKYKIGFGKARKLYGRKEGLSKRRIDDIVNLSLETKLLPNEIIDLLTEYTVTEIREGHWEVYHGDLIYKPKKIW